MPTAQVCTTQAAADLLGISVSSVQHLVEDGALEAWKTRGGHRRIPLAAVTAYMAQHAGPEGAPAAGTAARARSAAPAAAAGVAARRATHGEAGADAPFILVVEDDPLQRTLYQHRLAGFGLAARIGYCESAYQALIEIARHKPLVVLTDIVMAGIDGYEVVRTVVADPMLADTNIAILTTLTMDELEQRGGLPPGVVYFPKPVNFDELRGYLRACCASVRRQA